MNRIRIALLVFGFCLLPAMARADVIMPLAVVTVPLLPAIVLVEALLFRFLLKRRHQVGLGFWRAIGIVLLANVATSALGAVLPLPYSHPQLAASFTPGNPPVVTPHPAEIAGYFAVFGVAYALSVLVEWAIWLPFFRKTGPGKGGLFKVAILVNLASYLPLMALLLAGR